MARRKPKAKSLDHAAMVAAVLADLDDDAPLLVYGDWLQEQGDPRGALAVVHRQLYATWDTRKDPALVRQEREILAEHGEAILGAPLAKLFDAGVKWATWRHGFLDAVCITFAKKSKTSPYDVLTATLASPSSVFLRRLELWHVPAAEYAAVVKTLLASKHRPPLRELGLEDPLPEAVLAAFPALAGRRHGEEIERVEASDGPLGNVAIDGYATAEEYARCCSTRMITNGPLVKASFGLPIIEPEKLGGRPNRAAIAHAIERVVEGELGIPYSEPRQRAAAKHIIYWLEQIGDPIPKRLRDVAIGPKAKRKR
jgi:uncharacterized protein (TIGR02996 family)